MRFSLGKANQISSPYLPAVMFPGSQCWEDKSLKKKMYSSPIYFLLAHWDAVFYCLGWGEALLTTARAGTILFPPFVLGHILLNSHKIPAEKEFKRHPSLTDRWIWDELLSPVISWHSPAAPPSRSPAQNYNEGLDAPARLTV